MNKIITDDGTTVPLPNLEESVASTEPRVTVSSPRGRPAQSRLTSLSESQTFQGKGIVVGRDLVRRTGFPSDPLDALAEWYVRFHDIIDGAQGLGHEYTNDDRGETFDVAASKVSTTRIQSDLQSLKYSFEWTRGGVISLPRISTPPLRSPSPSRSSPYELAGIDLGTIDEIVTETESEFTVRPTADQKSDTSNTQVYRKGEDKAAVRRWQIKGRVNQNKNQFDQQIEALVGNDQTSIFTAVFPGLDYEVMPTEEFGSQRVAGEPQTTRYRLTLVEGQRFGDEEEGNT